jgi:TP901-1 family phage major tail protein
MAAQKGRLYLLKLGADGSGGTVAGVRTASAQIGNEAVEITNKDSAGWRTLLEGAGTQSVDISIDGVATDGSTYETLKGYAQAGSLNAMQLIGPDNDALSGSFLITSFQEAGAHNGEITFTASLQSSGTITFTQA